MSHKLNARNISEPSGRDHQLPIATTITGAIGDSPDPAYHSTVEGIEDITSAECLQSNSSDVQMDPTIGIVDDMWSQSDDCSITDEKTLSETDAPLSDSETNQFSQHERLKILALRTHIDNLSHNVGKIENQTQKTREELKTCRITIESLEQERDQICKELENSKQCGISANIYRLESKQNKVCTELEAERDLELVIKERLAKFEIELSHAELERGQLLLAEEDLKRKEQILTEEKRQNTAAREKKEKLRAYHALKRLKDSERDHAEALKETDRKNKQALTAAKRSSDNVAKYIKETVGKVRQQKEIEEERANVHMEKRVKTLLTLKSDIKANRENLKAFQARNQYLNKMSKQAEGKTRTVMKEIGKNVDEVMLLKKWSQEAESKKWKFCEEQKQSQSALVTSVLEEESQMNKRQMMYPQLFANAKREKSLSIASSKGMSLKKLEYIIDMQEVADDTKHEQEEIEEAYERPVLSEKEVSAALMEESSDDEDVMNPYRTKSQDDMKGMTREGKLPEDLAQPEFEGLWNSAPKPYRVPTDEEMTYTLNYSSKMEKEIMANALDKHRAGIIRKQIAAGREFRGCAFVSKPCNVQFKDFDVGKSYKKKIVLTNVSYSVNFLKLLDLSEHLKDFLELEFNPPGQMSAGMSCEVLISFRPLINEDLFGEVHFLAQTGPFSVPVHCTTKKCDISVANDSVDFGAQVIGETLRQTITIINKGAKGTKFDFIKLSGMKQPTVLSAGTSLGRMTTADESIKPHTASAKSVKAKGKGKTDRKAKKRDGMAKQLEEAELEPLKQEASLETTDPVDQKLDLAEPPHDKEEDEDAEFSHQGDNAADLDGMTVGEVSEGEIGPFGSVKLEIIYQPTLPGRVDVDFELRFSDGDSNSILIKAHATAIDVPVWVERKNVDLKICQFDRLYQDAIIINNRATTALRLTMEVCKELKNHLELLPKTAYIQAQSQFSVQLKFLPRQTLKEEAGELFHRETGVLEAPMLIRVADQTAAVPFTVHAILTSSDLEFEQTYIDFGLCTIHESVTYTVHLTNKSIIPQNYGFVKLPEYITIQPNDGFGILLPSETVAVDIIFSPQKAKNYSFQLKCKSGINRDFKLSCKAVGVHPPLELSHSVIHFAATTLEDSSVASFYILNNHVDSNEFTHPVPRVGLGPVFPVGPTSFEFVVPDGAPISFYPSVGSVKPGEKTCISVKFSPSLSDKDIREEAVRLSTRNLEVKARQEYEEEQTAQKIVPDSNEKNKRGGKKPKSPGVKGKHSPSSSGPKKIIPPKPEEILPESDDYAAGRSSLLRQFESCFNSYSVPCFVASGMLQEPGALPFDVNNTLYIHVHCPEVKPSLVIISNNGRPVTDFGEVSIGQRVIRTITIQNISERSLDLKQSVLDCHGPFQVLNSIRHLSPDATHTLVVAFEPFQAEAFYEVLNIKCPLSSLGIFLKGCGLQPALKVSVVGGVLDLGYILAGEEHTETFKLENSSTFDIDFRVSLDSLTNSKTARHSDLPLFMIRDQMEQRFDVGPANYNGKSVFNCIPYQGTLEPGKNIDISVTFQPDHPSDCYADVAHIELFGKQEGHVLQLKGAAKSSIMYITGADVIKEGDSFNVTPTVEEVHADSSHFDVMPLLLTFRALSDQNTQQATRSLYVGCVRTMAVSQKKNGEFFFDNLSTVTALGFHIEPVKGMVDAGSTKRVTIEWSPPKGHNPNMPLESNVILNVKGDVLERYSIVLHALVVTKDEEDN